MSEADDLQAALGPVTEAFRMLGIRFFVGGSVASSFHGAIRSTMDVDLVCTITAARAAQFVKQLGDDFYASLPAIKDAIDRKSCFNLIHYPTSYKIDVFVSRGREFDLAAMNRAVPQSLMSANLPPVPVATVEDSILSKLEWFRLTDETSERQWHDVERLIEVHGEALDTEHLWRMAEAIGVADLLSKLLPKS